MKKAIFFFVLVWYSGLSWVNAQDLHADLQQLLDHYQEVPFYCEITTRNFQKHSSTQPDFTEQSLLKRMGDQFLYETERLILLHNDQYAITYSKDQAVIFCGQKTKATAQQFSLFDFSQILEQFTSIAYKGLVGNDKCYILKRDGGPFSIMEFYFDQAQLQVKKVVYHHHENGANDSVKTEVHFKHLPMEYPFQKDQFSERQFVHISSGKVRIRPGLKNHHLVLGEGLDYAPAQ